MQTIQTITINDKTVHIFRLLDPAKRFIISDVYLSIPNQAIIDDLKNKNIISITQINYL